MDREKLEKVINIINKAIEKDDTEYMDFYAQDELYSVLHDKRAYFIEYLDGDNEFVYLELTVEKLFNLLNYIKSQVKDEDREFLLKNINERIKIFLLDDDEKKEIIPKLQDNDEEPTLMGFKFNHLKSKLIQSLENEDLQISYLGEYKDDLSYLISRMKSDANKIKALIKFPETAKSRFDLLWVTKTIEDADAIMDNIEDYLKLFGVTDPKKVKKIAEIAKDNFGILKGECGFSWLELFDEKYEGLFTKEQMEMVIRHPDIGVRIVNVGKNPKELEMLKKIMNTIPMEEEQYFQIEFTKILKGLVYDSYEDNDMFLRMRSLSDRYGQLIESIDLEQLTEEDIRVIAKLLQQHNTFNIKTLEDIKNYEEIKRQKCDDVIEGRKSTLGETPIFAGYFGKELLQVVVLEKLYGLDIERARELVKKYGENADKLPNEIETQYVKSLKIILDCEDEETLREFYNIDSALTIKNINPTLMEVNLKHLYGKDLNKGLLTPEGLEKQEDGTYKAGTDFKMIIHSVGAYIDNITSDNYNFQEGWNRGDKTSQGVCCSYITNDMMGTAPINYFCYGFNEMSEDALMLAGARDLFSNASKFNPRTSVERKDREVYYTQQELIDNTEYHNELVYKRFQNGKKKKPDYIALFKREGEVEGLEVAQMAAKQWAEIGVDMPIVVVDVEECIEHNGQVLEQMIDECQTAEDLREIKQKFANNRKTKSNALEYLIPKIEALEEKYSEKTQSEVLKSAVEATKGRKLGDMIETQKQLSEAIKSANSQLIGNKESDKGEKETKDR